MLQVLPTTIIGWLVSLLVAVLPFSERSIDPYSPDERVDVEHYVFRIELSDDTDTIIGHTTATVNVLADGVEAIRLNLVGGQEAVGMRVSEVAVDGNKTLFSHDSDVVNIALPASSSGRYEVDIWYQGTPSDGLIIASNKHGDRTFFGDNWPNRARHWLPTVDHPADKATCEFLVNAPSHYRVIASGLLVEETDLGNVLGNDRRLTHTKTAVPFATKVMVIGVAQFAIQHVGEVDGIAVESWVYPQDREYGFRGYRPAKEILEYFVDRIGPYPYQKLANVQSKTRYGGMENAGNIFYSEGSVSRSGTRESLLAHEIAHQWFGDSVSEKDWHHIWLSEGFATYMAALYAEHAHGRARLNETLDLQRSGIVDYHRRRPDSPVVDTTITNLNQLLSTNSYQKGGWVLHMLRNEIGDDHFWNTMQTYYKRHRDGNALTSDVRKIAEEISGKDLRQFFKQWLHQAGQPHVEVEWRYATASRQLELQIAQTQAGGDFVFDLEIEATDGSGGSSTHNVSVSSEALSLSFPIDFVPTKVIADPNVNLLATFDVTAR